MAFLALLVAMLILSSFAPAAKYIFVHSDLTPIELACVRVMIGFGFLCATTAVWDRPSLIHLSGWDVAILSGLGIISVGISYAVSAIGLQHTSVTSYVLIYSLTPAFTLLFSMLAGRDRLSVFKLLGMLLSLLGCIFAVSDGTAGFAAHPLGFDFGESMILLFTLLISFTIVTGSPIVKRYGMMTANTVMFGSSFLLLLIGSLWWEPPPRESLSLDTMLALLYIGATTAGVFLLRHYALRFLTPGTVAAYHNLVPIFGIALASALLGEAITAHVVVGGMVILLGVELVRRS
jgi:drug/metabolite transporter (DMT)-like permease